MPCPQCYESDDRICPKATDANAVCAGFCADPLNLRSGHGEYPSSFRNTLPPATRSTDSVHLDALLGYRSSPLDAPALTADEQGVVDNMATLVDNNLNLAVSILTKRPHLRGQIEARLDVIANTASQAVTARLSLIASRIESVFKVEKDKAADNKPGTGTAYKQATYPQATLFQTIVKAAVRGTELPDDSKEMFDPSTGKSYVPFEKSVKVQSIAQFMHAGHTFVLTMMGIKQEAPKVYYEFSRDIARVAEDKGPRFAQEYVDTILRFLDEKRFPSMVSLYQTGDPTRAFTELSMRLSRKEDDGKKKGDTSMIGKLPGPNGICNFGTVTKPMGGEGAGWIHRKCNRFHASPSRPCTAGIPPNSGFPDNIVGLCAFEH